MGPGKATIKREYSHLAENWEVPQYDTRLMRRLKRRSIANVMMEHNYSSNAKRKNVGTCGDEVVKNAENNGHVLEEEVDEDYELFLDKDVFHVDVFSDDNIFASDIDVNTTHDSDNDDDTDAQYKMFLGNLREDDQSYILKVFVDNQLFCVKYEGQEERSHDLVNSEIQCEGDDEDYQLFLNSSSIEGDNLAYMSECAITIKYGGSESEGKSSKVRKNSIDPFEVTELPNSRQASDDHRVAKNKRCNEVLSDAVDEDWQIYLNSEVRKNSEEKSSAVRQNLQASNEAIESPNAGQASDDHRVAKKKRHNEVLSDVVDEDWQIYLNSEVMKNSEETCSVVMQNFQVSNEATELPNARQDLGASHVAKHKCNSKELCNIMNENYQLFLKSVSTDGDNLIYMPENGVTVVYGEECDQSSSDSDVIILDPSQHYEDSESIYSKSYYSSNHKDSLYRKGLMEELERPYNQMELDKLLQLASHERPKLQHREMRHGVTKDRPKEGHDSKTSYLKMHSGLKDAIDQVKEPHKVLFLLRGFFYWLKHVPQGGAFRPWLDASCLNMLQKL